MEYEEATSITKSYQCAECESQLVMLWDRETYQTVCAKDRSHQGYREILSLTELHRQGVGLPIPVENRIEVRTPPVNSVTAMASMWMALEAGKLSKAAALQAAMYSLEVGLDPRHGEIACLEFKRQGKKALPVLFITTKGWRVLAARECPDVFEKAPAVEPIFDPQIKAELGYDKEDWVAIAYGRLKGDPDLHPLTGKPFFRMTSGRFTKAQQQVALAATTRGLPSGHEPQNQAIRRAERHWYETYLPEAREKARAAFTLLRKKMGADAAVAVIEAEFSVIDEGSEAPSGRPRQQTGERGRRLPSPDDDEVPDYTYFFKTAGEKGLDPPQALKLLGVRDWNEWTRLGGDLAQALKKLEGKGGSDAS